MSDEGDTYWVSLTEKLFGVFLIIIGALILYFTVISTSTLGVFTAFFGFLSIIVVVVGVLLLLVKPPE